MRPLPGGDGHPERGFYSLLAQYPAFTFSASVATITGLLFYVTSADSGALVLGTSPRS
jgi:choline/glycine/proline betaine transport protein